MEKPKWINRVVRRIRGLRPLPVRPDDVVTLGLLRMEDRVLLDAAGLVTDLGGTFGELDAPTEVATPAESVSQAVTEAEQAPSILEINGNELRWVAERARVDNHLLVGVEGQHLTFQDRAGIPIVSSISSVIGNGTSKVGIPFSALANVNSLGIDVAQGDDSVTFDLSSNAESFLSQFRSTRFFISEDHLRFVGDGTIDATLQLGARIGQPGELTLASDLDTTRFSFAFSDTIELTGMRQARLVTPPVPIPNAPLVLSEGNSFLNESEEALVARYDAGQVLVTSVQFHDNDLVAIDTGNARNTDSFIVLSAANDHRNDSLVLDTRTTGEAGGAVVRIEGDMQFADDVEVRTDRLTVNASIRAMGTVTGLTLGDIDLRDRGYIQSDVVSLASSTGHIRVASGANGIVAAMVDLTAGAGIGAAAIPISTSTDRLRLNVTGPGALFVRDTGDTLVERAQTSDGSIRVSAAGALTVTNANSLTNSRTNNIELVSESNDVVLAGRVRVGSGGVPLADVTIAAPRGRIRDFPNGPPSVVVANVLTMNSAQGIGETDNPFGTSVNELRLGVSEVGDILVRETSSVRIDTATTRDGVIGLSAGVSVVVGDVRALTDRDGVDVSIVGERGDITFDGSVSVGPSNLRSGDVFLGANLGNILGKPESDAADISSHSLVLEAGRGIGLPNSPLCLDTDILAAEAGEGLWIKNSGNMAVGTLEGRQGIRAGTDVVLRSASLVSHADVIAGGNVQFDLANSGNVLGRIVAGRDFTKLGSGNLALASESQLTIEGRTHVQQGNVIADGLLQTSQLIASDGVIISGSGILDGDALIGPGATLKPGSSNGRSIAILGELNLEERSSLELDLTTSLPSTSVSVGNGVRINGAELILNVGQLDAPPGTTFTLIRNSSSMPIEGNFVNAGGTPIGESDMVSIGQSQALFSYAGGETMSDAVLRLNDQLFFVPLTAGEENAGADFFNFFIPVTAREESKRTLPTVLPLAQETAQTFVSFSTTNRQNVDYDATTEGDFRLFYRVRDDALAREEELDIPLPADAITRLPDVFGELGKRGLPDGHYIVYLQEAGSTRQRVVQEIYIFEGKVVPENFRESLAEVNSKRLEDDDSSETTQPQRTEPPDADESEKK